MENTGSAGVICEVCGKAVPRRDDLLCGDCSRAFTLMLELLHGHPEVDLEDLDRVRDIFEWRMRKKASYHRDLRLPKRFPPSSVRKRSSRLG